ncbi:unnamed protein product [Mytilus edulis]|uniref:B box-type domain-containing protein n=1 Tax=Mytilus edulis TaxID=6550 RepID=A0A8S3VIP9_MYTED|nr:unnamed protein product [Mytilus edulis]
MHSNCVKNQVRSNGNVYSVTFSCVQKCQRLHKKVKSADQHNIIDIRGIAVHQQQAKDNPDFNNIPCEIHSGQNCCLFCETCNEVVCPLCIVKSHNKHDMIELADGFRMTVMALKTFNSELNVKLTDCVKGISKLSSLVSSEDVKYEREKKNILSRDKVLKDEVEMHTKKLLKELDLRRGHLEKSVNDADNQSQKINKDLEFRRESLTNALASVNTFDVFYAYKQETAARKQTIEPVNSRFKTLPQYEPGKLQIQETLHGKFITSGDEYSLEQYETKVIKQYRTGTSTC